MEGSRLTPEMIRTYTERGLWAGAFLDDHLSRHASERPEHLAVVSPARGGPGEARLTYRQLEEEVDRAARGLLALGTRRGDIVSVQLPNWYEFLVVALAASRIRAILNGITPIYRQHELRFILNRTASRLMVVPGRYRGVDHAEMMADLVPELPALRHLVVVAGTAPAGMMTFDDLLRRGGGTGPAPAGRPASANDLVQVAFTSGTTGEPKGVMHTHNTLTATVAGVVRHLALAPEPVNLVVSPVGHQTGFLWGLLTTLVLGGTAVFQPRWDPEEAARTIAREGVTLIAGATPFLRDLTHVPAFARGRAKTLHTFITAGAPIPPVVVRDAALRLGCTVHSAWGMTEYGIGTAVGAEDPQEKAATTDGRPVPGAEVLVVDDTEAAVAPGEEGDLRIRGAGLFIGYYERPDFTEGSFTPDGFLATGDRARFDASGFVRLTGRTKDIIIRGGEKIPVAEIEAMLYAHPKVEDVAVVAMPDERLGERACAYVVPRPGVAGLTLDELTGFLLGRQIAKPKLPERLELLPELPRTASGKVQKFKLREDIREKLAAADRLRLDEPGTGAR